MGARQSTMGAQQSTIHITNKTQGYTLRNPSLHPVSGHCEIPLPRKLEPSESDNALFSGSTRRGVFTYDLYNTATDRADKKIAVMFSFDYGRYSNWFAVGVFDRETNCDNILFNKMYSSDDTGFVRGKADLKYRDDGRDLKHRDDDVDVTLGMTNSSDATLKVEQI